MYLSFIISVDAFEDGAPSQSHSPPPRTGSPASGAGPPARGAGPRQPPRARRREIDFLGPQLTNRVTRSNNKGGSHSKNCLFF